MFQVVEINCHQYVMFHIGVNANWYYFTAKTKEFSMFNFLCVIPLQISVFCSICEFYWISRYRDAIVNCQHIYRFNHNETAKFYLDLNKISCLLNTHLFDFDFYFIQQEN